MVERIYGRFYRNLYFIYDRKKLSENLNRFSIICGSRIGKNTLLEEYVHVFVDDKNEI